MEVKNEAREIHKARIVYSVYEPSYVEGLASVQED